MRDSLVRDKKTAYITGSSHYKYNRMKDGDWGVKGPMRESRIVINLVSPV